MSTDAPRAYGIQPPKYRLPDDSHVGAVRLQVSDLARSIDYYEAVLGLRLRDRATGVAALGTDRKGPALVWLHEPTGARRTSRRGAFGLFHFAMLLPDRAALGRFAAHLGRIGAQAGTADHLVSEALYLSDPDGLGIEVYCDRPRAAWQVNGRELAMTTDPLDVQGLIDAGGGVSWNDAPAGTTIGHVHLHVGDLERAADFYHAALGFDKVVWSYPGALFFSAGGYHHHLGTNTWAPGPSAAEDQARLLEWEIVLPGGDDVVAAASSLRASGYDVAEAGDGATAADPWGTTLRVVASSQRAHSDASAQ
jgi:catechol 2,3-dioxygenase